MKAVFFFIETHIPFAVYLFCSLQSENHGQARNSICSLYMFVLCVAVSAFRPEKGGATQRNAARGSWPIGPSHFSDLTSEHSLRRRRKAQGAQLPN